MQMRYPIVIKFAGFLGICPPDMFQGIGIGIGILWEVAVSQGLVQYRKLRNQG
jgi:hypothetical protein